MLTIEECDFLCAGTTGGEFCGGRYKLNAYRIREEEGSTAAPTDAARARPEYIGCYGDGPVRTMNAEAKFENGSKSNDVSGSLSYRGWYPEFRAPRDKQKQRLFCPNSSLFEVGNTKYITFGVGGTCLIDRALKGPP